MSLSFADRVKESTTTTGTGTLTLGGAATGYRTFAAALADGALVTFCTEDGTNWEIAEGTFTASGTTLSRTTILASSNGGAAVSWGAGTKNVFLTVAARDITGKLFDSTLSGSASAIDTGASGIIQSYDVLEAWMLLRTDEAVVASTANITLNNDTGANYDRENHRATNATVAAAATVGGVAWILGCSGASMSAGSFTVIRLTIPGYTQTVANKVAEATVSVPDQTAANAFVENRALLWRSTAAISRLAVTAPSGKNFIAGSRLLIYGR